MTRPFHKPLKRNLTTLKASWDESEADLEYALNGFGHAPQYWDEFNTIRSYGGQFFGDTSLTPILSTLLPPFLYNVLTTAMERGYEYIGVLDDDACFTRPAEAIADVITAFMTYPTLAQTGPMGNLRKSWRYEGAPAFVEDLKGSPWTTLGCQIYRVSALRSLGDISWLNNLYFRADSLIALSLKMHGWRIVEQDLAFAHEMSTGLSGLVQDEAHHQRMLELGAKDWNVYRTVLAQYAYCLGKGNDCLPWYGSQIQSIARAHTRTHTPHIKNKITKRGE